MWRPYRFRHVIEGLDRWAGVIELFLWAACENSLKIAKNPSSMLEAYCVFILGHFVLSSCIYLNSLLLGARLAAYYQNYLHIGGHMECSANYCHAVVVLALVGPNP